MFQVQSGIRVSMNIQVSECWYRHPFRSVDSKYIQHLSGVMLDLAYTITIGAFLQTHAIYLCALDI